MSPPESTADMDGLSESLREIYITDDITDELFSWVLRAFRKLEAKSNDPIRIILHTQGGDETSMMALHDLIVSSPCPVHIHGIGEIVSAGVLILACGDTRLVTENVAVMCHDTLYSNMVLSSQALTSRAKFGDYMMGRWCALMGEYTVHTAAWWRKRIMSGEFWIFGSDAVIKAGLADGLVKR